MNDDLEATLILADPATYQGCDPHGWGMLAADCSIV